jgi:hypothetical protein
MNRNFTVDETKWSETKFQRNLFCLAKQAKFHETIFCFALFHVLRNKKGCEMETLHTIYLNTFVWASVWLNKRGHFDFLIKIDVEHWIETFYNVLNHPIVIEAKGWKAYDNNLLHCKPVFKTKVLNYSKLQQVLGNKWDFDFLIYSSNHHFDNFTFTI